MKKYLIKIIGELHFIRVNDADNFKEVCIDTNLPKGMEIEHELSDYEISVRFHNDGEIDVFIYDNEEEATRNIQFASNIRNEIIEFAKKYI
ncbi:hypothetical protein [Bacillus cereus group sp. TH152-1LC]|uniref:hypothetical protein n=1 Tax=Bacillus cereus group sp. TH152-1LC TaxID=3018060 RepID=UPI0022DF6046|nr:hypothetical protein [Bacillus cereus group sp. TH152-1LC]MDA1674683.1 hypothetical protein [Bacillus cereus group sp. TH152-1LC]